jgi:hypothetical protein
MNLQARPDLAASTFDLQSATPEFDKVTEDGLRYRVYKFGNLDVRTTQDQGADEVVGAVFSVRALPKAQQPLAEALSEEQEKIAKVTEYVEADEAHYRSYIVLETAEGNVIVTEKLADGSATWEENPKALEDRNAFAKFIRSWDCTQCKKSNLMVADLKAFKTRCEGLETGTSHSARKQYAQGAYNAARGIADRVDSGFGSKQCWKKSTKANEAKKETKRTELMSRRSAKTSKA